MKQNFEDKLWRYLFPALAAILWIMTIVLYLRGHGGFDTGDVESIRRVENALRWQPACCIGAVISSVAAYVVEEIDRRL